MLNNLTVSLNKCFYYTKNFISQGVGYMFHDVGYMFQGVGHTFQGARYNFVRDAKKK